MNIRNFCKKNISLPMWILYGTALFCIPLLVICRLSVPFADFFNRYISGAFRAVFAYATAWLPFSLAETLILISIPAAVVFLVYSAKISAKKGRMAKQFCRLFAVLAFLFSAFVLNFGAGYNTTPLAKQLDLAAETPTKDDLYLASAYTLISLGDLEKEIAYKESGQSDMPYSFSELCDRLNDAYDTLYTRYGFLSPLHVGAKQLAISKPMTYTHLSGFYACYTGEANVNINYPDYVIAFTAAHEMAHQRGIAREDEANFIAYLACTVSEDTYLRYAGHANMMDYLAAAMAKADPEAWRERLYRFYPDGLVREYAAYAEMFKPYRDNVASTVSDAVNDTYLKAQGQTAGTQSYGLVTDLAVAYIVNLEEVPK